MEMVVRPLSSDQAANVVKEFISYKNITLFIAYRRKAEKKYHTDDKTAKLSRGH